MSGLPSTMYEFIGNSYKCPHCGVQNSLTAEDVKKGSRVCSGPKHTADEIKVAAVTGNILPAGCGKEVPIVAKKAGEKVWLRFKDEIKLPSSAVAIFDQPNEVDQRALYEVFDQRDAIYMDAADLYNFRKADPQEPIETAEDWEKYAKNKKKIAVHGTPANIPRRMLPPPAPVLPETAADKIQNAKIKSIQAENRAAIEAMKKENDARIEEIQAANKAALEELDKKYKSIVEDLVSRLPNKP